MAYEVIRFTLADPHLDQLKELANDDSIHTTAKRLLQSLLDGQQPSQSLSDEKVQAFEDRLEALEQNLDVSSKSKEISEDLETRLQALEQQVQALNTGTTTLQVPENLESRLNLLERAKETYRSQIGSLKKLETKIENLEVKLDDIEDTEPREPIFYEPPENVEKLVQVCNKVENLEATIKEGVFEYIELFDKKIKDLERVIQEQKPVTQSESPEQKRLDSTFVIVNKQDLPQKYWNSREWVNYLAEAQIYSSKRAVQKALAKIQELVPSACYLAGNHILDRANEEEKEYVLKKLLR